MKVANNLSISRRDFMRLAAALAGSLAIDRTRLQAMAASIESKKELPVVVIGGGLGGLSTAAYLARNGFPVTLIEQHEKVGGYATTFDRAGGKYTFDVSLHATASAQKGLSPVLEGTGVLDKVHTVETPELCRIITPEHDLILPQQAPDAVMLQFIELFPEHTAGIKGFFGEMMGILDEAMKPFDESSWWDKLLFPMTHKKMWAIRKQTLADVLDRYVKDAKVRSLLSIYWPYYGLPPSRLSGFYYCIATAAYLRYGGYYIRERSQDLSDALAQSIETSGGEILLDSEVVGITLKRGAVSGVKLADGSQLEAKAVISNASVPSTVQMIPKGALPEEYLDKLKQFRPSISSFVVWLGLNEEIRGKVKGYEIHTYQEYDPEKAYQACLACDPKGGGLGVTIYDNAFEGYSRPGTSTVSLITLSGYEPWRRFETDYLAGRKDAYRKEKERIAKILVECAEKLVIPELGSMIEVMESASPLTNLRFTKNPEGAIYGYEQSLANSYMTRLGNIMPVKGIYLASAWTNPGGGYQPCLESGAKAFRLLVEDWGGKQ